MKKSIIYLLMLMGIVACASDNAGDETPTISKDFLSVVPSMELLAEGQTTDLTINANCNWSITKNADWLTVSPMSGSSTQTITVSAMKNSSGADRMVVLTILGGELKSRKITITQKKVEETPVQLYLSVNKTSLEFDKNGGSQSFVISSNTSWSISCPDWCSLSTSSGSSSATITVAVAMNNKTVSRSGQIILKGDGVDDVIVNVEQEAGDKDSSQPNPDDNQPPSW